MDEMAMKNLAGFMDHLPVEENVFLKLFDFIDKQLSERDCRDDFSIATEFCSRQNINQSALFKYLNEYGAFCDCEILNLEDNFQKVDSRAYKPVDKPRTEKIKLKNLKTEEGFCIENLPNPWILTKTISIDRSYYEFQLGKSNECVVTLESSFPTAEFYNNKYWLDLWKMQTELTDKLEDLIVERPEIDNYLCVVVKSKDLTPVFYWLKSKQSNKWHLKMKTYLGRHRGDLKELFKLLDNIRFVHE